MTLGRRTALIGLAAVVTADRELRLELVAVPSSVLLRADEVIE